MKEKVEGEEEEQEEEEEEEVEESVSSDPLVFRREEFDAGVLTSGSV